MKVELTWWEKQSATIEIDAEDKTEAQEILRETDLGEKVNKAIDLGINEFVKTDFDSIGYKLLKGADQ